MNKTVSLLIVLVIIVGALFAWQTYREPKGQTKNVDMFADGSATEILTETNVEYFPGAKGYFARPKAEGIYPGVVMIHENRGLRPEIRMMAETLAREGYFVLAVDLFGSVVETQGEARALTAAFDQETGIRNMQAAIAYLREEGATKIASLGWCFGGRQSLELAISGEKLDATVVYYGGGMETSTERLVSIAWPVLGIFGDEDRVIPVETVEQFKTSLATLGITHEVYIYPGVGHAFANPSGENYAPNETKDAWGKTLVFLEKYLQSK